MKNLKLISLLLLISLNAIAQQSENMFPTSPFFSIEYGYAGERDFNSTLKNYSTQKGSIQNSQSIKMALNIPIYKSDTWEIKSLNNYTFNRFEFENISTPNFFEANGHKNHHTLTSTLDFSYNSMLFNKPIVYSAAIIADGSHKYFGRVKGTLGFSMVFKNTERTTIFAGALGFIDPASPIPVLPIFGLNHTFNNEKWNIDIVLPQQIMLRRLLGKKSRLSLGTALSNTSFYQKLNTVAYNGTFEYNQIDLKTGFIFEHNVNSFLTATVQGGFQNFINNRSAKKGHLNDSYIYENKQDGTVYFQIGIAINPF